MDFKQIIEFFDKVWEKVEYWELNEMEAYCMLKWISKRLDNQIKNLWVLAQSQVDKYDLNMLPFWYKWSLQLKKTIKYNQDKEYNEIYNKLKERENILKNAVQQNEKWNTVVDEDGVIIDVPEYSYNEIFILTKRK